MAEIRADRANPRAAEVVPPYRTGGVGKFVSDTVSVFEINFLPVVKHWYLMLLMALGFPIPWFYVTRSIAPDDPDILRRLLAGTIVFGVTFSIGMLVGQNVVAQRFMGNLRLLITMPVSKGAYVLGSLASSSISGTITVVALLGFGLAAGVDIDVAWGLVPSLILSVPTMAGLRLLGYVSPLRYAADGIGKSLSGRGDVWTELAVLAGFAVVTMSLGLWRLPWREE